MRRLSCAIAAVLALSGVPAEAKWITTWTAAPTPPGAMEPLFSSPSLKNQTTRQVLRLSAGGKGVRIRLSNAYGAGPLPIGAARIALLDASGREQPGTSRVLGFGGSPSAVIAQGAPLVSDAVTLDVPPLARLELRLYFPEETGPCTCNLRGFADTEISAPGDFTARPFVAVGKTDARPFLAAVEIDAPGDAGTVVAIGDSLTVGGGSTHGANRRWPDVLAERLAARGGPVWGVANQGIGGNRVLTEGTGQAMLARLDRDVFSLPGVSALIVYAGLNDIGFGFGRDQFPEGPAKEIGKRYAVGKVDAPLLIAAYRQIVARAHALGIKAYGATIAPYKGGVFWTEKGEAVRQEVNAFIRTGGAFDAVFDFDAVLRDPADPARLPAAYHSGDRIHGSDANYRAIAESIDLTLFGSAERKK